MGHENSLQQQSKSFVPSATERSPLRRNLLQEYSPRNCVTRSGFCQPIVSTESESTAKHSSCIWDTKTGFKKKASRWFLARRKHSCNDLLEIPVLNVCERTTWMISKNEPSATIPISEVTSIVSDTPQLILRTIARKMQQLHALSAVWYLTSRSLQYKSRCGQHVCDVFTSICQILVHRRYDKILIKRERQLLCGAIASIGLPGHSQRVRLAVKSFCAS